MTAETNTEWAVGDTFWRAEGQYSSSRPADIGSSMCQDKDDADAEADDWLAGLTPRERESADAWVRQFRIESIEDDGTIGEAVTID